MKPYSPSATATWLTCPVKRALQREGWRSRQLGKRDAAACLGDAVTTGLALWNEGRQTAADLKNDMPSLWADLTAASIERAESTALSRRAHEEKHGCRVREDDLPTWDAVPGRAAKIVRKYIERDPIPESWTILGVEQTLTDHGYARPDLVVRENGGLLAVVDYKCKLTLDARYIARDLERLRYGGQMIHYAWGVGEVYGEPVARVYICLIRLEPSFSVTMEPFDINPERLSDWIRQRQSVWAVMKRHEDGEEPWEADVHSDNYGNCEYLQACMEMHRDAALMEHAYARVPRI